MNSLVFSSSYQAERGHEFETGDTFFRRESAIGRDLSVLGAAVHKKSNSRLRVLDAMCGCGIRSLGYLLDADADFVLANDANNEYRDLIVRNLSRVDERRWVVMSNDANRVMTECYLKRDFYDLADVDSFGSESSFLRSAMNCLKLGGLLYVTSTDGYSSSGHRPHQWSNAIVAIVVSGPLWTGPLHCASYMREMLDVVRQQEWVGIDTGPDLQKLFQLMIDESDPKLPFGYIKLDEVASRAKINSPPLRTMMSALQKEGYTVSRSHIATNAIKTDCPMATCITIAKEVQCF